MDVVAEIMDRPWAWGEADCCTAACDVFLRLHGIDPMKSMRGACGSRDEAERIISAMGGMEALADRMCAKAGLRPVARRSGHLTAEPGDLGLTKNRPGGRALCVCVTPHRWAAKSPRGFTILRDAERAWTCRR